MTPTERAVSDGHFFDPAQTQLREFAKDRPLVAERATDVTVESRLRVENADGEALAKAEASDSATVTVEREVEIDPEEYGSVGGDGGLTVETTE